MNSDLALAKALLVGRNTCVLVSGDAVRTSVETGVKPLLRWLEEGEPLSGFSAADKVIGRAAAMLFALAGVKAVYGAVMSAPAAEFLRDAGIPYEYGELTEQIINRAGTGMCPMEEAVAGITSPKEAHAAIQAKLRLLQAQGK